MVWSDIWSDMMSCRVNFSSLMLGYMFIYKLFYWCLFKMVDHVTLGLDVQCAGSEELAEPSRARVRV